MSINLAELAKAVDAKAELREVSPVRPSARHLDELIIPPDEDPEELLKHRFLCRGGGMLLAGPTGVGKSSLAMQAMILWALGREAFGIKPARPLKSLLVQAENDDGDLAEMRDGIMLGLSLSEDENARSCEMILVIRENQNRGYEFVSGLRPHLLENRPDLLWIDPALAYLGGAAGSQEDVGGFLRHMVTPLLREFMCGGILLHHSNKPPMGREKPDWQAGDYAYWGSGSIEWANWARAVLVLRSIGSHSVFELRAGKRGERLGWKESDGKSIAFSKIIAHAVEPGVICWRIPEESEIPKLTVAKRTPTKEDIMSHVPPTQPIPKEELRCKANDAGIALNRINGLINELLASGSLHEWQIKRPRTNPLKMLARHPQPPNESPISEQTKK